MKVIMNKFYLMLGLLLLSAINVSAIDISEEDSIVVVSQDTVVTDTVVERHVTGEVFIVVAQMPQFPGGAGAMSNYISTNIRYPEDAVSAGVQGRVLVDVIVDKEGYVCDAKVVRNGKIPSLDAEALRVVRSMPRWEPGMQRGEPVNVRYTVPVLFRLEQSKDSAPAKVSQATDNDDVIVDQPDQQAEFPGGMSALMAYLSNSIRYPDKAQKKNIQGRVIVEFVIDKEGSVTECNVKKKVHPLLDAEAIRVVESMPKWTPGMLNGEPVRIRYMMPVTFRLGPPAKKAK